MRVIAATALVLGLAACGGGGTSPSAAGTGSAPATAAVTPPSCTGSAFTVTGGPNGAGCFQATHCQLGGRVLNVQMQGQIGEKSYALMVQLNPFGGPGTFATNGGTNFVLLVPADLSDNLRSTSGSITVTAGAPKVSGSVSVALQGQAGAPHLAGSFSCTTS